MLGQVPEIVVDAGTIAAAITAVLALGGVLAKWGPIASRIRTYRQGRAHELRTAHAEIVRGVIATDVKPELVALRTTVDSLDTRLTEHMRDEMDRFGAFADRFEHHVQHHPGPGPLASMPIYEPDDA